jgi:hypothetical protein
MIGTVKVRMLKTEQGTVNNGFGNVSMTYLAGGVYIPPAEDAQAWLESGAAELYLVPSPDEAQLSGPSECQKVEVFKANIPAPVETKRGPGRPSLKEIEAKYKKKGKGR